MKRTLIFILFSTFSVLMFSGCIASGPAFRPSDELKTDSKALVYIYRPGNLIGCGIAPTVYVDEIKLGNIKNDGYLVCSVDPGKRVVELVNWGDPSTIYIDTVAGNEYYVRYFVDSDVSHIFFQLALIPKEFALREIQHTKKSE
jgi:hypothetical protein